MKKLKLGIVHGRFQPPHNGHARYILRALEHADKVIVGICTPKICSPDFAKKTGYPCGAEDNPFSHTERVKMISGILKNEGIKKERYSFIKFPSDYKNLERAVPKDAVFLMSRSNTHDDAKIECIKKIGYETKIIMRSHPERRLTGRNIRMTMDKNPETLKKLVPDNVARFLAKRML